MDGNGAGLPLHLPALPGQVAELLPVDLQGGVHGRHLPNLSPEPRQRLVHLLRGCGHRAAGEHRAGDILGVGGNAQQQLRFVGFFRVLKEFHAPGGAANEHRQHAGGHGIQGAAVADAAGTEHPPQPRRDVLARPPGGLVYNYNSVHIYVPQIKC